MKKSLSISSIFAVICALLLFSCAGKKDVTSSTEITSEDTTRAKDDTGMGEGVDIEAKDLTLSDLERVYFDFDDATLTSEARDTLKKDYAILKKYPNAKVTIEGHCDERGSNEYNLALGARRAESVKKYLMNLGSSEPRLSTISYGEERPLVMGQNESAWSKNRRGELLAQ